MQKDHMEKPPDCTQREMPSQLQLLHPRAKPQQFHSLNNYRDFLLFKISQSSSKDEDLQLLNMVKKNRSRDKQIVYVWEKGNLPIIT